MAYERSTEKVTTTDIERVQFTYLQKELNGNKIKNRTYVGLREEISDLLTAADAKGISTFEGHKVQVDELRIWLRSASGLQHNTYLNFKDYHKLGRPEKIKVTSRATEIFERA